MEKNSVFRIKRICVIALLMLGIVACANEKNLDSKSNLDEKDSNIEVNKQEVDNAKEKPDYSKEINLEERINVKKANVDLRYIKNDILDGSDEITLGELVNLVIETSEIDYIYPEDKDIQCMLIDCGSDEIKEQCIRIPFVSSGNFYEVICIINEEEDINCLQYIFDEGQNEQVKIAEDGSIEIEIPTDYGMCIENSFLDAKFERHFNYTMKYYLSADKYDKIHVSGSEWRDIQVQEYDFGEEKCYCCYFKLDENNEVIDENDEVYRKVFENAGLIVLSEDDIKARLTK